ncbi:MAG: NADH dehydrogenase [Actinobacteria bacterium]|nr:MAG: NADH dehydrogenase [Actinomycetota bacterium]MDO8949216.1 proton-conducting transporter membrane subunit [Actinomycetota bacterium]
MEARIVSSLLPPAAFLLPIIGAVAIIPLTKGAERLRRIGLAVVCVLNVVAAASFVPGVLAGNVYETYILQITPKIWMYFRVDAMGALFGLTAAVLWLIALVYSFGYMEGEHRPGRYYAFFILALAWTMGVAYAGNLLTFLIFYEMFSILTYPLIVHEETPEAIAAGTKYIVYILVGGSLVLLAIVFTFFLAGNQALTPAGLLTLEMGRKNLIAVFWCFIAGFGVKAALVPLHGWVPDAHPAAPAPFSAVLSGVMVAAGSFGIMRVVYSVFGVALLRELDVMRWLAYIAGFTVVFAALLAVNQENLKRRLAYSTISQMGYAALGVALLTEQATTGALVHITNHAFMKGALFLCAGLLIKRAGIRNVRDISGIAQKMPITSAAFAIAALSMIGTPPLSGFVSKWYLGLGMLDADQPLYLAVLLGGALLAAVYLLPIVYAAYFKPPSAAVLALPERSGLEAPLTMLVPLVAAIVLTIALGLVSSVQGMPLSLARLAAAIAFK